MILVGILLSTVGTDLETGQERLTFGVHEISDGIEFVVVAMGLFGFAEIVRNLEHPEARDVVRSAIGRLLPGREDLRRSVWPVLSGTGLGSALGLDGGRSGYIQVLQGVSVESQSNELIDEPLAVLVNENSPQLLFELRAELFVDLLDEIFDGRHEGAG